MSYREGSAMRRMATGRVHAGLVAIVVTAMVGAGLTMAWSSADVDAAPLVDIVDGSVCYSIDEGPGNAGASPQFLHEVELTNPPPAAAIAAPAVSVGSGNIENIAVRNDASELYAYDPNSNTMLFIDADSGVTTTPTEFNLSGLGDVDAMFFQNDTDGNPSNDLLWTLVDGAPDDTLSSYNAAGVLQSSVTVTLPPDQTIEGATWLPATGEFFVSYTETAAGTISTLASLGTGATPSGTPAVIGTTEIDVEGLGTDGDAQLFITTGEDPADGPSTDQLWHLEETTASATSLLDLSAGAPPDGDSDFESVDCAYASISLTKVATAPPVRLPNGNTQLSYTFTITNDGLLQLGNVTLVDPMTAFGTPVSGPTPNGGTCSAEVLAGTQTLNIGESCTAIWEYEVDVVPGSYDNTATVTGTPPNGLDSPVNAADTETVVVPDLGSIGDRVWEDTDEDGIQDGGEPGLSGITVNLWDEVSGGPGVVIDTATTDTNGNYLFSGLAAGNYFVQCEAPTGRTISPQDQGGDDALDSDPDPGSGVTAMIVLGVGENDVTVDCGLSPLDPLIARIGDRVWRDVSADGIQDAGEPGIAGVTVQIWETDAAGVIAPTEVPDEVTTDANGLWFLDVPAGNYRVSVVPPAGATGATVQNVGDDANDSDIAQSGPDSFFTDVYTVAGGEENLTIDAGIIFPAELGDFVWDDQNQNGVQDPGEPGVPGILVQVIDDGNNVAGSDTTDASGAWLVTGLAPGAYTVNFTNTTTGDFTTQDAGANDTVDSDVDPTGQTAPVTLVAGESNLTVDAGIVFPTEPGSIGDLVFDDVNGDGIQGTGEPGVGGVTVNLWDEDSGDPGNPGAIIATTTTSGAGVYSFTNLSAGNYFVQFVAPDGQVFTLVDQGGDDAADSDADPASGVTSIIALGDGEAITTVDAGLLDAVIGLAKDVSLEPQVVVPITDPLQWTIEYSFVIENLGDVTLTGVTLTDDFGLTFPSPANVVSGPTPDDTAGTCSSAVAAGTQTLAAGETCTAVWQVVVEALVFDRIYDNTATVTGTPPQGPDVSDISDDGVEPDANGNDFPRDPGEDDPTPVVVTISDCVEQLGQEECGVPPGACLDNDRNPIPGTTPDDCAPVLPYPGPFNNMPPGPTSPFEVPNPQPSGPSAPLAHTGTAGILLATLASAMLAVGGLLMTGARRRRLD